MGAPPALQRRGRGERGGGGGRRRPEGVELARLLAVQAAAKVDEVASRGRADPLSVAARAAPLLAEYVLDGRPLGLTLVRADGPRRGA